MKEFINALSEVKAIVNESDAILSIIADSYSERVGVLMDSKWFKEEITELGFTHDDVDVEIRDYTDFPYKASVIIDDVEMYTILRQKVYEDDYKDWLDGKEHETEHARARLTEYERKMKEAGLKESDFA